jgi:hypothetical protein
MLPLYLISVITSIHNKYIICTQFYSFYKLHLNTPNKETELRSALHQKLADVLDYLE